MNSARLCEADSEKTQNGTVFGSVGDPIADRRYRWALEHAARGELAAAADMLLQALERAPCFAGAWFALGSIRDRQADREGAEAAFGAARDCDPQDLLGAGLHLMRLQGTTATPAMTAVYVRRLFDEHAPQFERSLRRTLRYNGPELLHDAVAKVRRTAGLPMRFAATFDAGCGTGLTGVAFRTCTRWLGGVDLSPGMIAQARAKDIYDRLRVGDLLHALASEPAGGAADPACGFGHLPRFDLVLAADVFVYVPELEPVAAAVAARLALDGLFAFTVETHAGDGVLLDATLRYAHGRAHVREALDKAGLVADYFAEDSCRTERRVPAPGLVVVARRVR